MTDQRSMAVATNHNHINMEAYHCFNKAVTRTVCMSKNEEYDTYGCRYTRYFWDSKLMTVEIDNKKYCFTLIITESKSHMDYRYILELIFKNNGYLNSITAMTIYFNGQQEGYSLSLRSKNTNKFVDLSASMPVCIGSNKNDTDDINIVAVLSYQTNTHNKLQKCMKYLLESQLHSDFKIKVGKKTFNVHKAIIAAESDVLRNLLDADMVEKKAGQVELQGQDPVAVEAALEYIYTKKCNVSKKTLEIFKVAHFLQLEDLQEQCKDYMSGPVTVQNLTSILKFTSVYNSELKELRADAIRFMKKNINALINDDIANLLCDYLEMDTVTAVMQISAKCKIDGVVEKVMVYVREHYDELLNDEEFVRCIKAEPELMLKKLTKCFDVMKIS